MYWHLKQKKLVNIETDSEALEEQYFKVNFIYKWFLWKSQSITKIIYTNFLHDSKKISFEHKKTSIEVMKVF